MRACMVAITALTAACAAPVAFGPINPAKYASHSEAHQAFQVAYAKCRAVALNSGAQFPRDMSVSQTTNVTVNAGRPGMPLPALTGAADTARMIASSPGIDAYERGVRERQIKDTMQANYVACMATEGFVEQQQ